MKTYEPSAGTRIEHACAEAERLATLHKEPVTFKFNGIELTANPDCDPDKLVEAFFETIESDRQRWEQSAEGKAEIEKRETEVKRKQGSIDGLLAELDSVLAVKHNGLDGVMQWLNEFTPPSDDIRVKFDKAALAKKFLDAGFKENEHVGRPPAAFDNRPVMAEYIVGQVINMLNHGMPPHPVTSSFVEKYFKLP